MFKRIKEVLVNNEILRDIVDTINDRKMNRVKPLQEELALLNHKIESIEDKRKKYFTLYEDDTIGREIFRSRLQDLDKELDTLHHRKSGIELELGNDQSQQVTLEDVRIRLEQLEQLLRDASTEQMKTLLHLVIERINLGENKKINTIEMNFTEQTQQHFLAVAPSDEKSGGASPVFQEELSAFRIVV